MASAPASASSCLRPSFRLASANALSRRDEAKSRIAPCPQRPGARRHAKPRRAITASSSAAWLTPRAKTRHRREEEHLPGSRAVQPAIRGAPTACVIPICVLVSSEADAELLLLIPPTARLGSRSPTPGLSTGKRIRITFATTLGRNAGVYLGTPTSQSSRACLSTPTTPRESARTFPRVSETDMPPADEVDCVSPCPHTRVLSSSPGSSRRRRESCVARCRRPAHAPARPR